MTSDQTHPTTPISDGDLQIAPYGNSVVDWAELNRLYAEMPEGPWHALCDAAGAEIRQIDTDPTNKHHWPFRLCCTIPGQKACSDESTFQFLAGVLNAWPQIAAALKDSKGMANIWAVLLSDAETEIQRLQTECGYTDALIAEAFHEHRREGGSALPPWAEVDPNSGAGRYAYNFAARLSALAQTAATDPNRQVAERVAAEQRAPSQPLV